MESNDSPEIPDWRETSDDPGLPLWGTTAQVINSELIQMKDCSFKILYYKLCIHQTIYMLSNFARCQAAVQPTLHPIFVSCKSWLTPDLIAYDHGYVS